MLCFFIDDVFSNLHCIISVFFSLCMFQLTAVFSFSFYQGLFVFLHLVMNPLRSWSWGFLSLSCCRPCPPTSRRPLLTCCAVSSPLKWFSALGAPRFTTGHFPLSSFPAHLCFYNMLGTLLWRICFSWYLWKMFAFSSVLATATHANITPAVTHNLSINITVLTCHGRIVCAFTACLLVILSIVVFTHLCFLVVVTCCRSESLILLQKQIHY